MVEGLGSRGQVVGVSKEFGNFVDSWTELDDADSEDDLDMVERMTEHDEQAMEMAFGEMVNSLEYLQTVKIWIEVGL